MLYYLDAISAALKEVGVPNAILLQYKGKMEHWRAIGLKCHKSWDRISK